MIERPIEDIGPEDITPQDWFFSPSLAWHCSRADAVKQARALVETANIPIETNEDVRLVHVDGYPLLAPIEGGSESWLQTDKQLVVDAADCR
jgi:hypothetical protein